jgi:predicted phage terminase large subunit-like protein
MHYNRGQIVLSNGFIFMTKGADRNALGTKVGATRPTLIILDDIERGEANYTDHGIKQRIKTLTDDIFMLNEFAPVAIVGTTTRMCSIIDQIRTVNELRHDYEGTDDDFREELPAYLRWVVDERIGLRYWPALLDEDEPTMRSVWPEKWSLEWLLDQRHLTPFAKNFQCRPVSDSADYWTDNDIQVEQGDYEWTMISVDPAVTTKLKSDYTGIAVVSTNRKVGKARRVYIREAQAIKLTPDKLKEHVTDLINEYDAKLVIVETNQGGDLWNQLFAGLPAKFEYHRSNIKKELRAQQALDWYQSGQVVHTKHMPAAEEQLKNFPKVIHDDIVDAISSAVNRLLGKKKGGGRPTAFSHQWAS